MCHRPYLLVSGTVFGLVSIAHLLRVANGWSFEMGPWSAPLWISWFGIVGPALLSIWAFRLASRSG